MTDSIRIATLGALAVDGSGGQASMLLRRALGRPELKAVDAWVLAGGLTQHGVAHERRAARDALARLHAPQLVLPAPVEAPAHQQGGVAAWQADFPAGGPDWPRRLDLAEGRCALFGLDTARLDGGAPAVGEAQLAGLEAALTALAPEQRRVVALHHRPWTLPARHKLVGGRTGLTDARALGALLTEHAVDLVLYGEEPLFLRWSRGVTRLVSPAPLAGCGATGQRFTTVVSLALDTGEVSVERVHFAPPDGQPALAKVFAGAEALSTWVALAEKAYESEDSFAALAEAMTQRQARLQVVDRASEQLDGELRDLLIRAGALPGEDE
jgi:hypothetical protein